jgi:endonuclease-3 related protein
MSSSEEGSERAADRAELLKVFDLLLSSYGAQDWWPGDTALEVSVGAVLTQNTAWRNVAQAIENLREAGLLELEPLLRAAPGRVKALIAPAGYYNIKYDRLMNLLRFLNGHGGDLEAFGRLPLEEQKSGLLGVKGVGPETADSILLYAFHRPVFVVDAYTRRLFSRLGHEWVEKDSYGEVQTFFMELLPRDRGVYNEYHALIVVHSKDVCKKNPLCDVCCLRSVCASADKT